MHGTTNLEAFYANPHLTERWCKCPNKRERQQQCMTKRHDMCWLCTEELLGKSRFIMITDLSDTKKNHLAMVASSLTSKKDGQRRWE